MIVNNVTHNDGLNVHALIRRCFTDINETGEALTTKMNTLLSTTTDISQTQMLELQFEIGQYNAMLELASSVSKSLTDMMKTLAQRTS